MYRLLTPFPQALIHLDISPSELWHRRYGHLHYKILPLAKSMFIETNPIPIKTAMGMLGMCSPDLRLPLCEMEEGNLAKLKKALKDYRLLK